MIIQNNTANTIFLGWLIDYIRDLQLGKEIEAFGLLEIPDRIALTKEFIALHDAGVLSVLSFDDSDFDYVVQQELPVAGGAVIPSEIEEAAFVKHIADNTIPAFTLAYLSGPNTIDAADQSSALTMPVIGITELPITMSFEGKITTKGRVSNPGWSFNPKGSLFASTSGGMTQVPPSAGILQKVGMAITSTEVFIDISNTIVVRS